MVDSPGDNLLAEFPSALAAVGTAVEIHRALEAATRSFPPTGAWSLHLGPLLARCGLVDTDEQYAAHDSSYLVVVEDPRKSTSNGDELAMVSDGRHGPPLA